MTILFIYGRLHVGYRKRDWADVWFELTGGADDEGDEDGTDDGFKLTTGRRNSQKTPLEGEVVWHPPFDPANCESKKAKERKSMQREFLRNGFRFLSEANADNLEERIKELDDPNFPRWNMWFKHAKMWKKKEIKRKLNTRRLRERDARDMGVTEAEIAGNVNSDTSEDEESGYESERQRQRGRVRESMPPPPRSHKRQKRNGDSGGGRIGSTTSFPGSHHQNHRSHMSGGLGEQFTRDEGEEDMDTRDPTAQLTPPPTAIPHDHWRLPLSASADGPRRRGKSTSVNTTTRYDPPADYGNGDDYPESELAQQQRDAFPDEDTAVDEAIRQSQEPDQQVHPFGSEQHDTDESMLRSQESSEERSSQ